MDFHVAVAEASQNKLLLATVRAYRGLLMQTLHDMRDVRSARVTQTWHEDILEVIRARDPEGTRALMEEHLQDFEKRIRLYLQRREDRRDDAAIIALEGPPADGDRFLRDRYAC